MNKSYAMRESYIWHALKPLLESQELTVDDATAIYRCLFYSDQIADVSLGNIFRPNVERLIDPL